MRHKDDILGPDTNLAAHQKSVYHAGTQVHKLPLKIKSLSTNSKQYKVALKQFLVAHIFSADEFMLLKNN
jgi:hypothetical protein